MSFQDVAGRGSPPTSSTNGGGFSNRVPLSSSPVVVSGAAAGTPTAGGPSTNAPALREALLQFQHQVQVYEKLARVLGGPRDDEELRSQLRAQESVVKEVAARLEQQVGQQLRAADSLPTKGEKDKARAEVNKMSKDAQRLRLRFDNLTRGTTTRIRELDMVGRRAEELFAGGSHGGGGGGSGGGGGGSQRMLMTQHQQQQQQQQQQLQVHDIDERILQEREEEILAINQSVVKVNEIFRDLGELVSRQQEDIDAIEENVQHSHAAAKSGLEQVEKAAKYQAGCVLM